MLLITPTFRGSHEKRFPEGADMKSVQKCVVSLDILVCPVGGSYRAPSKELTY